MKALLKDLITEAVILELVDNLDEKLTDNEIQELLQDTFDEDVLNNCYVDYE